MSLDEDVSLIVSGVLGALLVGITTVLFAPRHMLPVFWIYVPMAGIFGGLAFAAVFDANVFGTFTAYASWQIPACIALYWGSTCST